MNFDVIPDHDENIKIPCPSCGGHNTQWVRLKHGMVSIMCWGECGMDFDVNGIWFMLNRWVEE